MKKRLLGFGVSVSDATHRGMSIIARRMRAVCLGANLAFAGALPAFAVPAATANLAGVSGDGGNVVTTVNVTMPNSPIDAITFNFNLTALGPSWREEVLIQVRNASGAVVLGWFRPFPTLTSSGSASFNQTFQINPAVTSQGNWRIEIRDDYQDTSVNPDYQFNSGSVVFNTTPPADTQKPVIAPIANINTTTDLGQSTASVAFSTTVSDNVDPPSSFTPVYTANGVTITSGHNFPVGTTTVTVTANSDTAGNVPDPISFTVTVTDDEKPVIAPIPNTTTSTDLGQNTASVSFATTVSDNVDPTTNFTPVYAIGGTTITSAYDFPIGTTTVTVTANNDSAGNAPDAITFDVTVNEPSFTVTKTLTSGSDPVSAPGVLAWTIEVENTGLVALTAPLVTDVLSQFNGTVETLTPTLTGGDTANSGTLDPNETWVYSAQYSVTQNDIDNGNDLLNTFTFSPSNAVSQDGTDTVEITVSPLLDVIKSATLSNGDPLPPLGVSVGDEVKYIYTLTNTGNVTFTQMGLTDTHNGTGALGTIGNCSVATDNGATNDTVVNGAADGLTTFGPADVVTCEALYLVTQADVDTLQ